MASSSRTRHGASANARRKQNSATRASSSTRKPRPDGRSGGVRKPQRTSTKARGKSPASKRKASSAGRSAWSTLALVLAGLVMAGWMLYPAARLQYAEARQNARLEQELAALQERNSELKEQVERLKTPEGVEEVARSQLGMVKEGENLYVVTNAGEETPSTTIDELSPSIPHDPPWVRLLDLLFGLE